MKKIKACVNRETGKLGFETVTIGEPGLGQVRVKMVACGVCHTDSVVINDIMPMPKPTIVGHEGVGIVEQVGPGVIDLAVGDHVVMSYPSCGVCDACRAGHPYACEHSGELFWGGAYFDGSHGVKDKDVVSVKVDTDGRSLIFGDVVVRVSDKYALAMHIDTDESNAAGCGRAQMGEIVK